MMWLVSRKNSRSIVLVSLMLTSAVSLSGCATWLAELREQNEATKAASLAAAQPASGPRLPDLPNDIRTCLMKQACQHEATKAASEGRVKPECTTADGIVVNYIQNDREKRACTTRLVGWWRMQQRIQDEAAHARKHPRSPRSTAGWP